MMKTITVEAPATIANLVCGFDVLGLALNDPQDRMTITLRDEPGLVIEHSDGYQLPTEPEKNVAGAALLSMMEELEEVVGFHVMIHKQIKPGSGLGSSAASSAGAVVGANYLLEKPFSNEDLVRFAMVGRKTGIRCETCR